MSDGGVEQLLRDLSPRVLGVLVRRYGSFETCEDAVQEALVDASVHWPREGIPMNPLAWLISVASRRWIEQWRSDSARTRREAVAAAALRVVGPGPVPDHDDTLTLLVLCCHPSLTRPSQVALTLRAVGGLTTGEIARAFLVPESTISQRISRAKRRIRTDGAAFQLPPESARPERVAAVRDVLYAIFNEGYTASSGRALQRVDLTAEAIRLTRRLHRLLPHDGEVAGLLALMLLTDARRAARSAPDGTLIPLAEQDRRRWDRTAIAEGVALLTATLASSSIGPYQVQAAIAAVHDEAGRVEDTDWRQILGLYDLLDMLAPGPIVALGRIVAVAMVHGPLIALDALTRAERDPTLAAHHRVAAVRAHLLEAAGDDAGAAEQFRLAARRTLSIPEQRYLAARAARLAATTRAHGGADG